MSAAPITPSMQLLEFTPSAQGTRVGFCKIQLASGLIIDGVHVHRGPLGTPYALLPGAPDVDRDRIQKPDARGNRIWRALAQQGSAGSLARQGCRVGACPAARLVSRQRRMRPLDAALRYANRGWPIFPRQSAGPRRKQPLTPSGVHDAEIDPAIIDKWWHRWPDALVGLPTGRRAGLVVLDIDVKDPRANGFDALEALGLVPLPATPMVHSASGGLHLYFAPGILRPANVS